VTKPVEAHARDPLTAQYFNERFIVRFSDRERVARRSARLFGRALSEREWGRLVGAFDDAIIDVTVGSSGAKVRVVVHHPYVRAMERSIAIDPTGRTFMVNEQLFVRPEAPAGLGTRIMAHQVREAARLGVAYIELTAVRGPWANGYYTWPRLGYNAPLPDALAATLPPDLRDARDLEGLFDRTGGAQWWREYGQTIEVRFELTPRSASIRRFRRYLLEREIRI
jgi:hypothetical protein